MIMLLSTQDDFLLRHYDSGDCQGKLGHSRASVIWHRAQVGKQIFVKLQFVQLQPCQPVPPTNLSNSTLSKKVIGIFAGFGILLVLASPVLLVAAPCIICCKCRLDPNISPNYTIFQTTIIWSPFFNFIKLVSQLR